MDGERMRKKRTKRQRERRDGKRKRQRRERNGCVEVVRCAREGFSAFWERGKQPETKGGKKALCTMGGKVRGTKTGPPEAPHWTRRCKKKWAEVLRVLPKAAWCGETVGVGW